MCVEKVAKKSFKNNEPDGYTSKIALFRRVFRFLCLFVFRFEKQNLNHRVFGFSDSAREERGGQQCFFLRLRRDGSMPSKAVRVPAGLSSAAPC